MQQTTHIRRIKGTILFDGAMSRKGYRLNKMCYSFNEQSARDAFLADEMAYCDQFGLTPAQKQGIKERDILGLIKLGGSIYYLAKFAATLNLTVQDVGAQQTGMSLEAFRDMLLKNGSGES